MESRNPEKSKGWEKYLRRERHTDGTSLDYVDPSRASQHQTSPVVELNNPESKTRVTRQGTVATDQPLRGNRPAPLQNVPEIKNLIP